MLCKPNFFFFLSLFTQEKYIQFFKKNKLKIYLIIVLLDSQTN